MTEGQDFEKVLDGLENAFVGLRDRSASTDAGTGDEYHEARNAARTMFRSRVSKVKLIAWLGMWRPHLPHDAVLELESLTLAEGD